MLILFGNSKQASTMWAQPYRKSDLEAGDSPLYPMMLESPQLRWAFIRKVYSILSIQLLATIAVASIVVFVHPVANFFVSSGAGLALYIVLIVLPFIGTICVFLNFYWIWIFVAFFLLRIFTFNFLWQFFAVLCPLYYYHQKHPVNFLLLGIFTVSLSFAVGLTCAFTSGKFTLLLVFFSFFLFFPLFLAVECDNS